MQTEKHAAPLQTAHQPAHLWRSGEATPAIQALK
jgi:hypothetical protein